MSKRIAHRHGRWLAVAALISGVAAAAAAEPVPDALLQGLQWRLVGPHRAGWGTMGAGIADQPDTFYFGGAGGGVWKSDDAGRTWQPKSEGLAIGAIGALALAPSNPKVLYAGTGQVETRWDIPAGDGVYRSDDGGEHWHRVGLEATRHIGAVLIDPHDPNTVLVAALGHMFAPNPERGVFRSSDGGKTWQHTLAINNDTGAVDLASDPNDPKIVFAATWQARNYPWLSYFTKAAGEGSGVYRSSDGGATWKRIVGGGFPNGKIGRIGLAATHAAQGTRVYAVVESDKAGGLYRSDDGGVRWEHVNSEKGLASGYFARATVAPNDPDTLYVMGRSIKRSTDAGKTFTIVKGAPGGDDYHHLWINPKHPDHMLTASDQGTVASVNGGVTWSSWYNQPTGQFYHLATDNRFPYWIYSGQQDNGTVGISSRSDYGSISYRDWNPVGGDERDDDIPDPRDPNIVYSSGLGGRLSRWDARTGEVQNITPWPVSSYGQRPTEYQYRYTWITPIAVSQLAPYPLYFGAQVLFRSTDQGRHWDKISPDLSARREGFKDCKGDLAPPAARACGYGVIFNIAPSKRDNDEIWVGTDDGLIQLTRDGGKQWRNVTPKALPEWALVSNIDPSATQPGVAYAAVDNHRQDDFRPHLFRTRDYGASWDEVTEGLPVNHVVSVVRHDPVHAGLLYAGTEVGVFVSFDDGGHWQSLQRNLPVAWVRDLEVKGDDLIAATQGRAIWILDGLNPLREAGARVAGEAAHLFRPGVATRVRRNQNKDTPLPPDEPVGENPPTGAVLDYWLAADAKGPVVLEIHDSKDAVVRRFASDDAAPKLKSQRYFAESWLEPAQQLSGKAGAHRFVWDLRYPRPRAAQYEFSIAAVQGRDSSLSPAGPLVLPGDYQVVLSVDGQSYRAPLSVRVDPRIDMPRAELEASLAFSRELAKSLDRAAIAQGEADAVRKQLAELKKPVVPGAASAEHESKDSAASPSPHRSVPEDLRKMAAALDSRLDAVLAGEGDRNTNLTSIAAILAGVASDVEGTDRAPVEPQREVLTATNERLERALKVWQALKSDDLAAFNARLKAVALGEVKIPMPAEIDGAESPESDDLP